MFYAAHDSNGGGHRRPMAKWNEDIFSQNVMSVT